MDKIGNIGSDAQLQEANEERPNIETGASLSLTQENAMILVAQTKIMDESYDLKAAEEDVDRQTFQVVDKVVTESEIFVKDQNQRHDTIDEDRNLHMSNQTFQEDYDDYDSEEEDSDEMDAMQTL